jgi:hypothetical protein
MAGTSAKAQAMTRLGDSPGFVYATSFALLGRTPESSVDRAEQLLGPGGCTLREV